MESRDEGRDRRKEKGVKCQGERHKEQKRKLEVRKRQSGWEKRRKGRRKGGRKGGIREEVKGRDLKMNEKGGNFNGVNR